MTPRLLIAALAAVSALALSAADSEAQRRAAPARADWTRTAVRTPEGGFRMGNPNAPIKLIEYMSLSCVHCQAFARESHPRLAQNYIRPGRVSVEYRNIVLNGPDLAATLLARCAAPRAYFDMSHELLATREQWLARMGAVPQAQRAEISRLPPMQAVQRVTPLLGLDRVAARHGLTPAAQRACLSNQANYDRIEAMARAGHDQFGVEGTPTFIINGRTITDTNVWAGIEPLLSGR
jgi:protein-disulfide isomerase